VALAWAWAPARAAHCGSLVGAARVCRWLGDEPKARPPRAAVDGGRGALTSSRATCGPVRCAVGGEVCGNLFCVGGPRIRRPATTTYGGRQAGSPSLQLKPADKSNPLITAYMFGDLNSSAINIRGSRLGVHSRNTRSQTWL
jgi:hypothetical protein